MATLIANGASIHNSKVQGMGRVEAKGGVRMGGATDSSAGSGGTGGGEEMDKGGGGRRHAGGVEGAGGGVAVGQLEVVEGVDIKGGSRGERGSTVGRGRGKGIVGRVRYYGRRGAMAKEKTGVSRRPTKEGDRTYGGGVTGIMVTLLLAVGRRGSGPHLHQTEGLWGDISRGGGWWATGVIRGKEAAVWESGVGGSEVVGGEEGVGVGGVAGNTVDSASGSQLDPGPIRDGKVQAKVMKGEAGVSS